MVDNLTIKRKLYDNEGNVNMGYVSDGIKEF